MLPFSGFCRRFLGTMSGGEDLRSLKAIAASISLDLKRAEPRRFDGDYMMPPFIPKPQWTELGDALSQAEKYSGNNIPGNKYITLRLDGSGFSKMLPKLRRAKAFSPGYSEDFGRIMRECCISLMEQFNCLCGYTQSDEITVIIQPASVIKGEQMPHSNNGRVLKLCTLAATNVASLFNFRVSELIQLNPNLLAKFDCRLGQFDTLDEALSLILWRAYDCGVNSLSDACHQQRGILPDAKQAVGLSTLKKLEYLQENKLLPLPPHQASGSFFVKVKKLRESVDPRTNESVLCLRSRIVKVDGNVLALAKEDNLFPPSDTEEEKKEEEGEVKEKEEILTKEMNKEEEEEESIATLS